ncbi:MAG TPA: hypothetical protein QF646_00370 [Candidatus Poseidoniales archaeon]|nr:hypothetical protein [Candidatus Poseidoniales archaeon]
MPPEQNDPGVDTHRLKQMLELVHRQMSFQMALSVILCTIVLFSQSLLLLTGGGASLILGLMLLLPIPLFLIIWSGFRNRAVWALRPAPYAMYAAALIYGWLALVNLLEGSVMGYIMGFLVLFFIPQVVRIARSVKDPRMEAFFRDELEVLGQRITQVGEVLAACPTCSSVLAIVPSALGPSDKCPVCSAPLVTMESE